MDKTKAVRTILAAGLSVIALQAGAQTYPAKPVHVIISFTAGSSTDIVGRLVTQKLSEIWAQPVLVDNRAGAGGSIGTNLVAKAAPDGYTLLINSTAHTVNPAIYAKLPYDTTKDLIDIVPLSIQPNVLVVETSSSYKSAMDIVNAARAKPGAINWGHAGIGSGTHLSTEKFIAATKIDVTQIPFKGTPEVLAALFSKSVDCYWGPISAVISSIKSGRLRALAVSTPKRNSQLPDIPTTGEAGISGADSPLWFGLWAPAGTPAPVIAKISADTRKALSDPGVREKLGNLGNDVMDMSPDEFARYVRNEIAEYDRVIKRAGIKPQ